MVTTWVQFGMEIVIIEIEDETHRLKQIMA